MEVISHSLGVEWWVFLFVVGLVGLRRSISGGTCIIPRLLCGSLG